MSNDELEPQLKQLIIEALMLEDVDVSNIDSEAALFGDGLGLDSIDALELAIAIERRFGVKIQPSQDDAPKIFASVRTLAAHLSEHMTETTAAPTSASERASTGD